MAQLPKHDPELEQIARVARAGAGRSELARWLRLRHDEFLAVVEETRPDWRRLAEGFAALGMTGPNGEVLTAGTVRMTWYRVRRAIAAGRAKRAARAAPLEPVAVERPSPPAPVPASRPEAPPARPPEGGMDAKDALAELRRQLNQRSGRKPDA